MTSKQRQLLDFIIEFQDREGHCPSFDEMRLHLGVASKSTPHRLLNSLEEQGYVCRVPHHARTVEILRRPDDPITDPYTAEALSKLSHDQLQDLITTAFDVVFDKATARAA